ncbi:hypothetical protein JHK82_050422 [Glycine max]|nr:hypothetical protein JHK86_050266 [Glycine max]KAG5091644.1 hypothetical protein JHK82_050422 [Glycine max]
MADVSTSKADPTLDPSSDNEDSQPDDIINSDCEELIFKSIDDLIKRYNQLLSASAHASVCEEVKALLDVKVSNGQKTLLKDFQDLKERNNHQLVRMKSPKSFAKVSDEKMDQEEYLLLQTFYD